MTLANADSQMSDSDFNTPSSPAAALDDRDEGAVRDAILRDGIWIDPRIYGWRPHLVPFAVRDGRSRSKAAHDGQETWGAPDAQGYFRDDNSLIKNWVKSIAIRGPHPTLDGTRLGNGYVACHVWRAVADGRMLHADPLLNSFVPNLVWLPRPLARLSDRVGSYTQRLLQVMARRLYADVPFEGRLAEHVRSSWSRLPPPDDEPALPDVPVSLFAYDARVLRRAHSSLCDTLTGIRAIHAGQSPRKVYSRRYGPGLHALEPATLAELIRFLEPYVESEPDPG